MPEWRIYYADGTTFDSGKGEPKSAPAFGVQVIVQYDSGKQVISRSDYYWFDGIWYGGDLFGLFDFLARDGGPVKFGRCLPRAEFDAIHKRAVEDPDFPNTVVSRQEKHS